MSAPRERPDCVQLVPDTIDAGAENQARYLLAGLRDHGRFAPRLAYFARGRGHAAFAALGVPEIEVPRRGRLWTDLVPRARRLRRALGDPPPAILHTWLLEGNLIGLLAARRRPETKLIISQRGSWNELDYPFHTRLQGLLIGRADHAISNSPGGAEMLAGLGMDPDRISVIGNGVPLDRVEVTADREATRERLGWGDAEVVAWVGRLDDDETVRHKDFGSLLSALERLRGRRPRARLALIGPTREDVEARGFEIPEWAEALGWQDRPAELIDAADALALSSRFEGSSNVVAEALLLGLPVASTDCGGHCEAVRGAGGSVVPVGEPDALAGALAALLGASHPRDEVAARARASLSVERMVERTAAVYERLLAG